MMGYICFKCKREVKEAVYFEGKDYCYHCADKYIEYPKEQSPSSKDKGQEVMG